MRHSQNKSSALEETRLSNTTYLSGVGRLDKSIERGKIIQNQKELKRKMRAYEVDVNEGMSDTILKGTAESISVGKYLSPIPNHHHSSATPGDM
jgi:hypothetical protein